MATSKKNYVAVAAAIRESVRPATAETAGSIRELAARLANIFAADNPRFDRQRFLAACGVAL